MKGYITLDSHLLLIIYDIDLCLIDSWRFAVIDTKLASVFYLKYGHQKLLWPENTVHDYTCSQWETRHFRLIIIYLCSRPLTSVWVWDSHTQWVVDGDGMLAKYTDQWSLTFYSVIWFLSLCACSMSSSSIVFMCLLRDVLHLTVDLMIHWKGMMICWHVGWAGKVRESKGIGNSTMRGEGETKKSVMWIMRLEGKNGIFLSGVYMRTCMYWIIFI